MGKYLTGVLNEMINSNHNELFQRKQLLAIVFIRLSDCYNQ